MNIALISMILPEIFGGGFSSDGSCLISALLKQAGHKVKHVFIAGEDPTSCTPAEAGLLHEVLKDADLTLVAVYSVYVAAAIKITEFVHRTYPGMQVIWGGASLHCRTGTQPALCRWRLLCRGR